MNGSRRAGHRAGSAGFTIIELLITVTILGILAVFALPSMNDFVRDQRVKTAISDFYASVVYARSEAIKRNADVVIVPNDDENWAAGWKVQDAGGTDLRVQNAIGGIAVTGEEGNITYRRNGRLSATVADFVLSSPDSASVTARCLRIDPSGRPNIKVDTNGNAADGCQ